MDIADQNSTQAGPFLSLIQPSSLGPQPGTGRTCVCPHLDCTVCAYIWTAGIAISFMTATLEAFLKMHIHYKHSAFTFFKVWKTVRKQGRNKGESSVKSHHTHM